MSANSKYNPQPVDAEDAYYRRTARAQDVVKDKEEPRVGQKPAPAGRTAGSSTPQK